MPAAGLSRPADALACRCGRIWGMVRTPIPLIKVPLLPLARHDTLASRVRAQPVNERLRMLGGTARVALDLLQYDRALERAFVTVCG